MSALWRGERFLTVDHHLPQAHYPVLTTVPLNLVPGCGDCNKAKQGKYPTSSAEETWHPYFDTVRVGQWLHAKMTNANGPSLVFSVVEDPPVGWTMLELARMKRHFKVFELATLYQSLANTDLAELRERWAEHHALDGPAGVRRVLQDGANEYSLNPNSWQHVGYKAASEDDWSCSEGFALLDI